MNPKGEALQALKENGYQKMAGRKNARHDLYFNAELHSRIPVSRSSHFDEYDRDVILREIKQAKGRGKK